MRTKYLLLVGLAALLGSCQNENEPKTSSVPGTEGDYRIIIEGDETDSPSRAGEKSFVGGTASGAGLYDGDKTAIVSATPNSDYEIDYFWGGPASDPDKYTTSSTAATTYKVGINGQDHTFHLKFKEKKREVTINAGTGGRVNPSGPADYKVMKAHNITATPNSGYEFTGWSVSGSGITLGNSSNASTTFTLASNYSSNGTITASFKQKITYKEVYCIAQVRPLSISNPQNGAGTYEVRVWLNDNGGIRPHNGWIFGNTFDQIEIQVRVGSSSRITINLSKYGYSSEYKADVSSNGSNYPGLSPSSMDYAVVGVYLNGNTVNRLNSVYNGFMFSPLRH